MERCVSVKIVKVRNNDRIEFKASGQTVSHCEIERLRVFKASLTADQITIHFSHCPLPRGLYTDHLPCSYALIVHVRSKIARQNDEPLRVNTTAQSKYLRQARNDSLGFHIAAGKSERKSRIFIYDRQKVFVRTSRWQRPFKVYA